MAATGSAGTPHYMAPEMLKTSRHGWILPRLFRHSDSVVTAECRLLPSLAWPARRCSGSCACTATVQLWREGGCLGARLCPVRSRLFLPSVGTRRTNRFVRVCAFRCYAHAHGWDHSAPTALALRSCCAAAGAVVNCTQASVLHGGHLVVSLRRYELCGLRRPFDGNGIMAIMHSICFVRLSAFPNSSAFHRIRLRLICALLIAEAEPSSFGRVNRFYGAVLRLLATLPAPLANLRADRRRILHSSPWCTRDLCTLCRLDYRWDGLGATGIKS
jgi:hypothetical protein